MADEKKIIIDEDWKSQVEAEKRAAQPGGKQPAAAAGATGSGETIPPGDKQMPPASFAMLVTMLATEAMMAMGQMPHPVTGETQVQPSQAKYLIDTLDMLREKTTGNLSPDESLLMEDILHQLRMAFVATTT